jgi:uncharacterized protein YndB with AHSA1/START domain
VKKKLLLIVLTPIALIVAFAMLLLVVGLLTPKGHVVTKTIKLKQKPETVWQAISDFQNQPSWRNDLQKVERMPDRNGREIWKETFKNGEVMPLETTESIAPNRLVKTMADPEMPFSGVWEMNIKPEADGSSLTITERGEIPNPLFRGVFRVFFSYEDSIVHYQKDIAKKFGETAAIE